MVPTGIRGRADLTGVTFGNGTYVVVGSSFTNSSFESSVVLASLDGETWEATEAAAGDHLREVSFDGSRFVAVGEDVFGGGRIQVSVDGRAWTAKTPEPLQGSTNAVLFDVTVSAEGIVAVGRQA